MVTLQRTEINVEKILYFHHREEDIYPVCCQFCKLNQKMTTVPQGLYMVDKLRKNENKFDGFSRGGPTGNNQKSSMQFNETYPPEPLHYSKKMMDSIWGLYNRYSVHNLKKNFAEKNVLQH